MIEYILNNYKDNLMAMGLAYVGIISIIAMFLPKNNIINKLLKEFKDIFKK
jgi:hypothetical protein